MPYIKRQARHTKLRVLLEGTIDATERDRETVARMMGCSTDTVTRRLKNPGTLRLDELTALGRGLHIPIEELREAIQY